MQLTWRRWALVVAAMGLIGPGPLSRDYHAPEEVLARVGLRTITSADLDARVGQDTSARDEERRLRDRLTALRIDFLMRMIDEHLLTMEASRRRVDVMSLLDEADAEPSPPPSDVQLRALEPAGSTSVAVTPIPPGQRALLTTQWRARIREQRIQTFRHQLRQRAQPVLYSAAVRLDHGEAGTRDTLLPQDNGPIAVLVFGDLYCPSCRLVGRALERTRALYGAQVRVDYRHFPLPSVHPHAQAAARAAWCAEQSGLLWQFFRALDAQPLGAAPFDLEKAASAASVPLADFNTCRASQAATVAVGRDMEDGFRRGVRATPTIVINDLTIEGVPSSEELDRLVAAAMYGVRGAP